ncbi:type IV secretion system DNA-binding domain-containing protein [Streptomyces sp. NPDC047072]|uniref:type IV secretory system conjugative DNA transfer family protein n=1 Tax=Streptomyces sp. NPDC047072 TaxID=3154809 RepID=UPI003409623D
MSGTFLLVASLALSSATIAFISISRSRDQRTRDSERISYRLDFPRDLHVDQVTAFVRALTSLQGVPRGWLYGRDSVVFEGVGRTGAIEHRLRVPISHADQVLGQLRGIVPGVRTTVLTGADRLPPARIVRGSRLTSVVRPLRTDQPETFAVSLLDALQPLAPSEALVYQLVVYPVPTPYGLPAVVATGAPVDAGWLARGLRALTASPKSQTQPGSDAVADARTKTSEPWFAVVARVGAATGKPGRARYLVSRLGSTLLQLSRAGVALTPQWLPPWRAPEWLARAATAFGPAPIRANAREVATMVAWPLASPAIPGLELRGGRTFAPARNLPRVGRVLGQAVYPGMERPVAVTATDALMHQLVTGPTGSGKSTLLLNEIVQDMQAGHGVILLDPGGDLVRDAAERIPARRLQDLIYLDAADECPVGINPLDCPAEDAELVADQVLELVRANSNSWGPRLEEVLKAALVLLAASSGMTLVELPAVLTDSSFRDSLLRRLDPTFASTVGAFFLRFSAWGEGERQMAISAVLNKITPLTDRRQLRAMLGQAHPAWKMQQVIDERKILLVALPSGLAGSYAVDLLGGLLVSMVWNAVMRRAAVTRDRRQPTSLYIDEAARFLRSGADLTDMLARARGHGLGIVAALQHISQVPPALRAALLSEARTKVVLQPGADDATTLAKALGPLVQPQDLLTLEPRTALATLVVGGQVSAPVSLATQPPPEPTGCGPDARAGSAAAYGQNRQQVEQDIAARRRASNPRPRQLQNRAL